MQERICLNCRYFWRHYVRDGKTYIAIAEGHCVFPRCKIRKVETPACAHDRERPDAEKEDGFNADL